RRVARAPRRALSRYGGPMIDADAFARLLTGYCLDVQPGQQVHVSSTTLAAPLLLALQREILERGGWPLLDVSLPGPGAGFLAAGRGGWPLLDVSLPGQAAGFWAAARDEHLDAFPPADLALVENSDASLRIDA